MIGTGLFSMTFPRKEEFWFLYFVSKENEVGDRKAGNGREKFLSVRTHLGLSLSEHPQIQIPIGAIRL